MKIKEIMTKPVRFISVEINAAVALRLLFEQQISGLPVLDEKGRLVGMFTENNVLSYLLPGYISKVGRFIYKENPKSVKNKFLELKNVKVSKLMRQEVITANEDMALCEVARIMLTQKARRLPVLDNSGKVVGIVARCDILKAIAKETGD